MEIGVVHCLYDICNKYYENCWVHESQNCNSNVYVNGIGRTGRADNHMVAPTDDEDEYCSRTMMMCINWFGWMLNFKYLISKYSNYS